MAGRPGFEARESAVLPLNYPQQMEGEVPQDGRIRGAQAEDALKTENAQLKMLLSLPKCPCFCKAMTVPSSREAMQVIEKWPLLARSQLAPRCIFSNSP